MRRNRIPPLFGLMAALLFAAPVTARAQVLSPRLADGEATLILLDEIREPPQRRQPGVLFTVDPSTGRREIRVSGRGMIAPPSLELRCDGHTWTFQVVSKTEGPDLNVAVYGTGPDVATQVLRLARCDLVLAGARLPVPLKLLRAPWGRTAAPPPAPPVQARPPGGQPRELQGEVIEVVDGDTIRVRLPDGVATVRYIDVDAPELRHPTLGEQRGAREAMRVNRSLVQARKVRLELDAQDRDQYGRLLAYVHVGDLMANAELARLGYAQAMTSPPNVRHAGLFRQLEREAREAKRGLWADPAAAPAKASAAPRVVTQFRRGVKPEDAWSCPLTHPIKGNFTTSSGERCIHHVPGGEFYPQTRPERCYATEEEARQDGCRRSKL